MPKIPAEPVQATPPGSSALTYTGSVNGHTIPNDERTVILFKYNGGASTVITFETNRTEGREALVVPDHVVTIPTYSAGPPIEPGVRTVGPFRQSIYGDTIDFTLTNPTDVQFYVLKF